MRRARLISQIIPNETRFAENGVWGPIKKKKKKKKNLNPNRIKPGWPGVGNTRAVNDAPPRDPLGRGASLARARPKP